MKKCPNCSQTYADDTLRFCLSDGTPLIDVPAEQDEATLVHHSHIEVPIAPPAPPPEQATYVRPQMPGAPNPAPTDGSGVWKALVVVLLLLLIVVIGAGIGFMVWFTRSPDKAAVTNAQVANTPLPGTSPMASPSAPSTYPGNTAPAVSPAPTRTPKPAVSPEPEPKLTPEPSPLPTPRVIVRDPGMERLKFRRGSISETYSGVVSRERRFVLRTLNGQWLNAAVRSQNGCVSFTSGSSSVGFATGLGDSYLAIRNNCDRPVTYSMSVTIR